MINPMKIVKQKSSNVTKRSSRDTLAPRLIKVEGTVQILVKTSGEELSRVARAQLALELKMKQIEIDRAAKEAAKILRESERAVKQREGNIRCPLRTRIGQCHIS